MFCEDGRERLRSVEVLDERRANGWWTSGRGVDEREGGKDLRVFRETKENLMSHACRSNSDVGGLGG